MATFTITTNAYNNLPPKEVGSNFIDLAHGATHVFTKANFTTETSPPYRDPEGDEPLKVKVVSQTYVNGELRLSGTAVSDNDEITIVDIEAGNLIFVDDGTNSAAHQNVFTFQMSDVGSSSFGSNIGSMNIDVAKESNSLPTTGDNNIGANYGEVVTFTQAMFTTDTTPPYFDPEGDLPAKLVITSLPTEGTLRLAGTNVTLNQEIDWADVGASQLTYSPDALVITAGSTSFGFSIIDIPNA